MNAQLNQLMNTGGGTSVFDPLAYRGTCHAWYDASETSSITEAAGLVSQWDDISNNSFHLVQTTGSLQPITGTTSRNGKNTILWDGADDELHALSLNMAHPKTIFCVVDQTSLTDSNNVLYDGVGGGAANKHKLRHNGTNYSFDQGASVDPILTVGLTDPAVTYMSMTTTDATLFVNGLEDTEAQDSTTSLVSLRIGRVRGSSLTSTMNGVYCEIIIYSEAFTAAQAAPVVDYLKSKWAIVF